jgi:hypothetical protein
MSATACADSDLHFVRRDGLKWFRSSEEAQRGFCQECGSVLFWKGDGRNYTALTAGSLEGATGLPLDGHIFCEQAGDYYEICGGQYRRPRW